MTSPRTDTRIPLQVRVDFANAALEYADALVEGDADDIDNAMLQLQECADDMRICLRAIELGMDNDD